ncbi:hypothetical protein [Cryobacterium sp. PH31-L1]|uniref:hypothetical protein n=1 Tax=Cryobacterium sp. PH31-L1 TaxID=3046199 RepID=UPI0024B8C9F8|nr:hypothetical protein [Cryobacterium sp. PH31-L1]MDJ0376301.1 hypothetical protein [Cryobacterium sp. PH31-L1]
MLQARAVGGAAAASVAGTDLAAVIGRSGNPAAVGATAHRAADRAVDGSVGHRARATDGHPSAPENTEFYAVADEPSIVSQLRARNVGSTVRVGMQSLCVAR